MKSVGKEDGTYNLFFYGGQKYQADLVTDRSARRVSENPTGMVRIRCSEFCLSFRSRVDAAGCPERLVCAREIAARIFFSACFVSNQMEPVL